MIEFVVNSIAKLDEANFYLSLMDRIEIERSSLTDDRQPEKEFGYLLSAFLNSCYSCIEYLAREKSNEKDVVNFKKSHPEFYKSGRDGGWRTQAVHYRPVTPEYEGYIPPPGNNAIIRFREKSMLNRAGGRVVLKFGPGRFYFTAGNPQNSICDLCAEHVCKVKSLVELCASRYENKIIN